MKKILKILALGLMFCSIATEYVEASGDSPGSFPKRFRSSDATIAKHPAKYRLAGNDAGDMNLFGYRDYSQSVDLHNGWCRLNSTGAPAEYLWSDNLTNQNFIMGSGWTVGKDKVCGYFVQSDDDGMPLAIRYQEMNAADGSTIRTVKVPVSDSDLSTYNVLAALNDFDDCIYGFNYTADADAIDFVKAPASNPAEFTVVAEPESVAEIPLAFCFRADRNLFFGVLRDGWLVSIDTNCHSEKMFDTGIKNIAYIGSMAWNSTEQVFYFNAVLKETDEWGDSYPVSHLYKLDPQARTATQICVMEPVQTFTVLSTLTSANRPEAPEAPEFVSADFIGGKLEGNVTFRLPDKKFNGEALSGTVGWTAYDGDTQVKTGYGEAGSEVIVQYSSLSRDFHTFRMIADANDLNSLPGSHTMFVGYDNPVKPANVTVNGDVVSWDAVTEGVNGGYVNPANIEYKVYFIDHYDTDDNLPEPVVARTVNTTSCSLDLDPEELVYAYRVYVVAVANDQESTKSETVKFNFGRPYSADSYRLRPYADQADVMSVVTYSGIGWRYDIYGWEWMSGSSETTPVDSWLILPPVQIDDASKAYKFTLEAANASSYSPKEFFEVRLGKTSDPASMDQFILPKCGPTTASMDGEEMGSVFAVSEAGVYYPAIRCVSDPDQSSVVVWGLNISETENALTAPAAASDIVVTPATDGETKATAKFKMPDKDLAGNAIANGNTLKAVINCAGNQYEKEGTPGEEITLEVAAVQNENNLAITCRNGDYDGATVYTRFHAGIGIPGAVSDLHSVVGDDNRSVTLTWGLPEESPEGLYFPDHDITYWLVERNFNQWSVTEEIGIDQLSYVYTLPEYMERQYETPLGVIAENEAGMSPYFASTYHILGNPYPLPLEEYIPGGETSQQYFSLTGSNVVDNWNVYYVESVDPEMANESGVALMNYPDEAGQRSRFMFAKFTTEGWKTADLNLHIWSGSRLAPTKVLARCAGDMAYREIGKIEPNAAMKWQDVKFTLPEGFGNKGWVEIVLESEFQNIDQVVAIENYTIIGNNAGGICDISTDNSRISVSGNEVIVHAGDSDAALTICDIAGKIVVAPVKVEATQTRRFTLDAGIYIVRLNGNATRVMIR